MTTTVERSEDPKFPASVFDLFGDTRTLALDLPLSAQTSVAAMKIPGRLEGLPVKASFEINGMGMPFLQLQIGWKDGYQVVASVYRLDAAGTVGGMAYLDCEDETDPANHLDSLLISGRVADERVELTVECDPRETYFAFDPRFMPFQALDAASM